MSLRSPLRAALGHGSANSGSGHWYAQRVSAVALVVLGLWFLGSLVSLGDPGHAAVVRWLQSPLQAALCALLVLASAYHAWLGLQVVIEDYVGHKGVRLVALVVTKFVCIVAAVVGTLAVLRIAAGAA